MREHLNSLALANPDSPTCLTIGAFDGVHRGHQRVLRRLLMTQLATGRGHCRMATLTFFPLPKLVLGTPEPHFYLTAPDERARLLHELGIELVITHPFDEQVRTIQADRFVDALVAHLDVKEIWVGADFALGYQRKGDVPFLHAQGEVKGFVVHTVDLTAVDGMVVSSSLIRRALKDGRIGDASHCLGRPFRLPGRVVHGDGRGRKIGFPTANLQIWEEQAYPAHGVYAARAWLGGGPDGESWLAAVNIGVRPTLTAGLKTVIEAHLLDFDGDLNGKELRLDFLGRIRDEIRFDGLDQLTAQLQRDMVHLRHVVEQLD